MEQARRIGAWLLALMLVGAAQAASVSRASPQGEASQVRQVTVTFAQPVVPLGDARHADPYALSCRGAAPAGSGRWVDAKVWVYDLRAVLPPGVRCTLRRVPGWRPAVGDPAFDGPDEFGFSTGGPAVLRVEPWPGGAEIDEDAHFLLTLNGAATPASVGAHAWCEVDGIGERVPVRLVEGAVRDQVFKARRVRAPSLLLACQRPLSPQAAVRLVWGPGIAAANNPQVLTRAEQRFDWRVRARFSAEFSCERERAEAACLPLRPLALRFSAPVARRVAEGVRLQPAAGAGAPLAPRFDPSAAGPDALVDAALFPAPLPPETRYTLVLPPDLRDDAGRPLANAANFPLAVATGPMPPLAKFAAAPFGIVELEGGQGVLPVTLRHVQPDLLGADARGKATLKHLSAATDDAELLGWIARVERYHESGLSAQEAGLPKSQWTETVREPDASGRLRSATRERRIATRELTLLAGEAGTTRLTLPASNQPARQTEMIGLPLPGAGYHVAEIESPALGAKLLAAGPSPAPASAAAGGGPAPAAANARPMFVRTGVLVTNLGVHFKRGRTSSVVWVTTLDRGRPVADAAVAVNDCNGRRLWSGRTDAHGLARIDAPLADAATCRVAHGLFVTARSAANDDLGFVFGDWNRGIEPWRFNLPTSAPGDADAADAAALRVHTVFDRTLLRAGETVSMKHVVRRTTPGGLALPPPETRPERMVLLHVGSDTRTELPLAWRADGRHALVQWAIPANAKLGQYDVILQRGERAWTSGSFRVEAFRVPLVDARISAPAGPLVAPKALPLALQLTHLAGGGVAGASVSVSALLRDHPLAFPGYEDYSFTPPRDEAASTSMPRDAAASTPVPRDAASSTPEPGDDDGANDGARLVADQLRATTDRHGAAQVTLPALPALKTAADLSAELRYSDPNGEVQTASQRVTLWPSAVVPGVRARSWAASPGQVQFQAVLLDTAGQPVAGREVTVIGRRASWITSRKRLVGGFYAYDQRREVQPLGTLCSAKTDARGLIACEARLQEAGEVELVARAGDDAGRAAEAATSVWITGQGDFWFAQDNDDRIDLVPERRSVAPGTSARLQVRMPYREATALVAVEREGVLHTQVVTLRGEQPVVEVAIPKAPPGMSYAPNVYVSVLALRGRLREVPWYSLFTWGWRAPLDWWRAWRHEGPDWRPPGAMVDLSKPSFKLGVAQLQVGLDEHRLDVQVSADRAQYRVRETARVQVRVTQHGKPLAGAEIAFAAVDEGLLALKDNTSWDLLGALFRPRDWSVETATAQGEIVGRRHYGRKAVPAGGGGGRNPTRELFDTLLLWKGAVALDAQGAATIEVPLNDSLTRFRLVAVADAGADRYGTGSTTVRVTQDLQLLPGLPPLVREGDRYDATFTLRNTTARAMQVRATLAGTADGRALPVPAAQSVALPAGGAAELVWPLEAPAGVTSLVWQAAAAETGVDAAQAARDGVKVVQTVRPAVPARVLQATLAPLDGAWQTAVAAPADALPAGGPGGVNAGGVQVGLLPRLAGDLPGVRRWLERYPYGCLEQKASQALGLHDTQRWAALVGELPNWLDADGLALYFPPAPGDAPRGSDRLTAYLVAASAEAAARDLAYALPKAVLEPMLQGLAAFVEGRVLRQPRAPRPDLDVRKLAALEALSRHGRASARMLGSIDVTPAVWPTAALIDWLVLLQRVDTIPERAQRLNEARQLLRARLVFSGSLLRFSTEDSDGWWWLMDSADGNAARLLLAALDDAAWRDELPRLVTGLVARQRGGAWGTTTANLWGTLALDGFAAKHEAQPVAGRSSAALGAASQSLDWAASPRGGVLALPWPAGGSGTLDVRHQGAGKPWLSVQTLAAIPLRAPFAAGYRVTRSVGPVQQKTPGRWSRGDVLRVTLQVDAQADMGMVVVSDPVPAGATLLGSGLGRDSAVAIRGEKTGEWLRHVERGADAWRGYHEWLPRGTHTLQYTLRLNQAGRFQLPPTRVEAMYAPDVYGEAPNTAVEVAP